MVFWLLNSKLNEKQRKINPRQLHVGFVSNHMQEGEVNHTLKSFNPSPISKPQKYMHPNPDLIPLQEPTAHNYLYSIAIPKTLGFLKPKPQHPIMKNSLESIRGTLTRNEFLTRRQLTYCLIMSSTMSIRVVKGWNHVSPECTLDQAQLAGRDTYMLEQE